MPDASGLNTLLIGARASGKTELGRRLSLRLGLAFVDLDDVALASFAEESIATAWGAHGESAWRAAEVAALDSVLRSGDQVVALGGGTPIIHEARKRIEAGQAAGQIRVIYLDCTNDELARRLAAVPGDRPSLTGAEVAEEIAAVRQEREPVYAALADHRLRIDDDEDIEPVLDRLVEVMLEIDRDSSRIKRR